MYDHQQQMIETEMNDVIVEVLYRKRQTFDNACDEDTAVDVIAKKHTHCFAGFDQDNIPHSNPSETDLVRFFRANFGLGGGPTSSAAFKSFSAVEVVEDDDVVENGESPP